MHAKFLLFIFLVSFTFSVNADEYCPELKTELKAPKNEGDPWYIPESAFTAKKANEAIKVLSIEINSNWRGSELWALEDSYKMIRGYIYKQHLAGYKKEFGEKDKEYLDLKTDFCNFLRNEAIVSH